MGIAPLKAGSDADPHAWQSVANAEKYVANIRDALVAADPVDADVFRQNAKTYLAKLEALDGEVRQAIGQIPESRRRMISTHDAFGYFAARYGIAIIGQVKAEHIPAVFLERIGDPRLMRRISEETGAKVGGTLYSDSLTDEKGEAPTYIDMVRHNIRTLTSALAN
jgi:zinc/manganese transport system substrate-binding protein